MAKPRVFFLADGGPQTGYGHISRCTALASYLENEFDCQFILPEKSTYKLSLLGTDRFEWHVTVTGSTELEQLQNLIEKDDLLVVDGYRWEEDFFNSLNSLGCGVVHIDDHYYSFPCDALINPSPAASRKAYPKMPDRVYALGTPFVMLRYNFYDLPERSPEAGKLLVCLGGSQVTLPEKLLDSLRNAHQIKSVCWIGQLDAKDHERLAPLPVEHLSEANTDTLIRAMQRCEWGLFSAGTLALEACAIGIPSLLLLYVENQKENYRSLVNKQAIVGIGSPAEIEINSVEKGLERMEANRAALAHAQQSLIDGQSPERFRKLFNYLVNIQGISIRSANSEDVDLFFRWANDPEARQNSTQTQAIPYDHHVKWFEQKIQDERARIYVFEKKQEAVGYLRLEQKAEHWLISYAIDPAFRGQGLGKYLIGKGMKRFLFENPGVDVVFHAWVKKSNPASAVTFKNCNFETLKEERLNEEWFDVFIWKSKRAK